MADKALIENLRASQKEIRAQMVVKRTLIDKTKQKDKRDQMEALCAQRHALIAKIHALNNEITAAEQPVFSKTKAELAELGRTDASITQTLKSLEG